MQLLKVAGLQDGEHQESDYDSQGSDSEHSDQDPESQVNSSFISNKIFYCLLKNLSGMFVFIF